MDASSELSSAYRTDDEHDMKTKMEQVRYNAAEVSYALCTCFNPKTETMFYLINFMRSFKAIAIIV